MQWIWSSSCLDLAANGMFNSDTLLPSYLNKILHHHFTNTYVLVQLALGLLVFRVVVCQSSKHD